MNWNLSAGARELLPVILAGPMLLLASLINFLDYNDYPLLRSEIALIAAAAVVVGAIMIPFYQGQRQWGRSILEGFLTALFIDLNSTSISVAVVAGLAVTAFTWQKKTSLLGPLAVIGGVVLVTTALGIRGQPSWVKVTTSDADVRNDPSRPAILHLILDEHLGLEGFEQLGPSGAEVGHDLRQSYTAAGFAVYGGAYSEYMRTVNSLPHIFNFGNGLARESSKSGARIGATEYFRRLRQAGYRIKVFQTDFADICSENPVAECTTYDSSSLRPTLAAPLTLKQRSQIILSKFAQLSSMAAIATGSWNIAALRMRKAGFRTSQINVIDSGRTSSVASLAALDEATRSLATAKPGDMYLMHILLPHYPYVVDRNCNLLTQDKWRVRWRASTLRDRQRSYFGQVRCTSQKVGRAIEAFTRSAGKNAIIIVHGDHGSRITNRDPNEENLGRFSDSDVVAGFSTLFAVRAPGIKPGYTRQPQPIDALLHDFVMGDFQSAPPSPLARVKGVYLDDDLTWTPRRQIPLPKSWPNSEKGRNR